MVEAKSIHLAIKWMDDGQRLEKEMDAERAADEQIEVIDCVCGQDAEDGEFMNWLVGVDGGPRLFFAKRVP